VNGKKKGIENYYCYHVKMGGKKERRRLSFGVKRKKGVGLKSIISIGKGSTFIYFKKIKDRRSPISKNPNISRNCEEEGEAAAFLRHSGGEWHEEGLGCFLWLNACSIIVS